MGGAGGFIPRPPSGLVSLPSMDGNIAGREDPRWCPPCGAVGGRQDLLPRAIRITRLLILCPPGREPRSAVITDQITGYIGLCHLPLGRFACSHAPRLLARSGYPNVLEGAGRAG